jgi:hypothetical protein
MIRSDLRDQLHTIGQLRLQAIVKRSGVVNVGRRVTWLVNAPEAKFDQFGLDLLSLLLSHFFASLLPHLTDHLDERA